MIPLIFRPYTDNIIWKGSWGSSWKRRGKGNPCRGGKKEEGGLL